MEVSQWASSPAGMERSARAVLRLNWPLGSVILEPRVDEFLCSGDGRGLAQCDGRFRRVRHGAIGIAVLVDLADELTATLSQGDDAVPVIARAQCTAAKAWSQLKPK